MSQGRSSRDDNDEQVDFKFRVEDDVGSLSAENDDFLEWTFYDHGYLRVLRDSSDRRSVVVGRTGIGKSALLLRLRHTGHRVRVIDPLSISLETLVNQSLLPKLASAGVNLDPFFRFFWRYVFVVEVLHTWQEARKDFSWKTMVAELSDKFRNPAQARRRAQILDDIRQWTGPEFWERADTVAKKIFEKVDRSMTAALKLDHVGEAASTGSSETSISSDLVPKAQSILNELCVQRVKESYELLSEDILTDPQKPLFILIDRLDTAWVDAPFYYQLINALIDVVGEFAELENVKIVIALREDIVAVLHGASERHRQREKQETMFLRIHWTQNQLREMIDDRLTTMLKDRYGGEVSLRTLLPPKKPHMAQRTEDYVLDRALQRPRDLIDFINRALRLTAQEGRSRITWDLLNRAELEYSHARLKAIEDEWRINYPGLGLLLNSFRGFQNGTLISQLESSRLNELIRAGERSSRDALRERGYLPHEYYLMLESGAEYYDIWQAIASVLYRIGFLGVKFSAQEPLLYAFELPFGVDRAITDRMPIHVHPAFSRVLSVRLPRGKGIDEVDFALVP